MYYYISTATFKLSVWEPSTNDTSFESLEMENMTKNTAHHKKKRKKEKWWRQNGWLSNELWLCKGKILVSYKNIVRIPFSIYKWIFHKTIYLFHFVFIPFNSFHFEASHKRRDKENVKCKSRFVWEVFKIRAIFLNKSATISLTSATKQNINHRHNAS